MKPNKYITGLLGVMGVCAILSWVTTGTAKAWFEGIITLAQPVFLFVVLVSMVAERRASEAKRKTETGVLVVRPQVMSSHFSLLAGSVDIKLPDGAGYAMLTAAGVALVVFGILIYILLKKKKQPDDKD